MIWEQRRVRNYFLLRRCGVTVKDNFITTSFSVFPFFSFFWAAIFNTTLLQIFINLMSLGMCPHHNQDKECIHHPHISFLSGCTILHPYQQLLCTSCPAASSTLDIVFFSILAILVSVVLICIFMTNDIEHLFMC